MRKFLFVTFFGAILAFALTNYHQIPQFDPPEHQPHMTDAEIQRFVISQNQSQEALRLPNHECSKEERMNHNLAKHKVTLELSKDYCDRCHKAIAVSESRVIWLQKKYHKDCFEAVKSDLLKQEEDDKNPKMQ